MTDISKNDQWKERNLLCKTVLGFLKIALCLTDQQLFLLRLPEFKLFFFFFFAFNFDGNFLKWRNFVWKAGVQFFKP